MIIEIGTGYKGKCDVCGKTVTGRSALLRRVMAQQKINEHLRAEHGIVR